MKRILTQSVILVMCFATMPGCIFALGAAGGAGGVVYYKGNLKEYLNYSVMEIHTATLQTMADEGIQIYSDSVDTYKSEMKFEDTDGRNIWVDIEASTQNPRRRKR